MEQLNSETENKLFMIVLGATPPGRVTEQHDVFFGIGKSLKELLPEMKSFWPEAKGKIHIDAWREVNYVDGYRIEISESVQENQPQKLFFLNLGGYKPDEFEEFHYKILTVAKSLAVATKNAKQTAFFKHCGFAGAESHIDDKYAIGLDEFYKVEDLLANRMKNFKIVLSPATDKKSDLLHPGYLKISKL